MLGSPARPCQWKDPPPPLGEFGSDQDHIPPAPIAQPMAVCSGILHATPARWPWWQAERPGWGPLPPPAAPLPRPRRWEAPPCCRTPSPPLLRQEGWLVGERGQQCFPPNETRVLLERTGCAPGRLCVPSSTLATYPANRVGGGGGPCCRPSLHARRSMPKGPRN